MARTLFSSPLLLGFDQFEDILDRIAKSSTDGFPPYNIERVDDHRLHIVLAVAGFTPDSLAVTVEQNQLVVRGRHEDTSDRVFVHRGIAARQFQRTFILADGMEVSGASLENGLLVIALVRPEPRREVRTIQIRDVGAAANPGGAVTRLKTG